MLEYGSPARESDRQTTRIDGRWIIAYQDGQHRLLENGSVVVQGDEIVFVGRNYKGAVDKVVDCGRHIVAPGLISMHAHSHSSPTDKSMQEDVGNTQFGLTGLIEFVPAQLNALDNEAKIASVRFSLAEQVRNGTTTVLDIGDVVYNVAEAARAQGIRAYVGSYYQSGMWRTHDGRTIDYEWRADGGMAGLDSAVQVVEHLASEGGLVRGVLSPLHVDTSTEELLARTMSEARRLRVPVSIHASQALFEFREVWRRTGMSPISWLNSIGFLDRNVILGHAVYVTGNSWVEQEGNDLDLIAASGASVAYNCWCFIRRGVVMESFSRYLDAGINVCLGTDTTPQSMIEAMRWTAISGKVADRRTDVNTAKQVFDAATLGAADALARDDLGRLAVGAKADIVCWSTDSLRMTPIRDPLRNLVYYATQEDVDHVIVDGEFVIHDRENLKVDETELLAPVQAAAARMWANFSAGHWNHKKLEELAPGSLEPFDTEKRE